VIKLNIITPSEKLVIRELAKQVAELAHDPIMDEYKRLWRCTNALKPERPMIIADQICWNEMDVDNELTLVTKHPDCQNYERELRQTIYRRKYMPDDMPVEPFIRVPKAIHGCGLGVDIDISTLSTDASNNVVSQRYKNQFASIADVEKIKMPTITHDTTETTRRMAVADELFDGILPIRAEGNMPYLSVWDQVAMWMSVEDALYAMIDEPEMMHAIVSRAVSAYLLMLDQLEGQGLLCGPQSLIHCTGAYTDELSCEPGTKNRWMYGLAQMLGTVSPSMYNEFELEPCKPIFERFGLVYYGCCEPMDGKIEIIRKIKNIRKLSISPWANQDQLSKEIMGDWVFSRKPNPAYLATEGFDEDIIRADLTHTKDICNKNGNALEFIQKDISTVKYQPQRLWKWVKIAREVAEA